LEHALTTGLSPDLVVGVQVGHVGDVLAYAQCLVGAVLLDGGFQRAEDGREVDVLLLRHRLLRKDQYRVLPERLLDGLAVF
jgi:hypothetical protein